MHLLLFFKYIDDGRQIYPHHVRNAISSGLVIIRLLQNWLFMCIKYSCEISNHQKMQMLQSIFIFAHCMRFCIFTNRNPSPFLLLALLQYNYCSKMVAVKLLQWILQCHIQLCWKMKTCIHLRPYIVMFSGNFNCMVCLTVAFLCLFHELCALRELH